MSFLKLRRVSPPIITQCKTIPPSITFHPNSSPQLSLQFLVQGACHSTLYNYSVLILSKELAVALFAVWLAIILGESTASKWQHAKLAQKVFGMVLLVEGVHALA